MQELPADPSVRATWTHRLAVATALAAVPLVVFGGSVTTLGAGMAVEGWLVAEGHFLVAFPVEKWFRDLPTFVEHTHRLFGVLVGLLAVAACLAAWLGRRPRAERAWTAAALGAVVLQGTLGGFRVLEASPRLAFLHGAFAHAVFAFLCLAAFHVRPRRAEASPLAELGRARVLACLAAVCVYAQVVVGAWYRHALRTGEAATASEGFVVHFAGALAVLVVLFLVVARLASLPRTGVPSVDRAARRLGVLLGLQVILGLFAWAGYRPDSVGPLEWAFSVLHVLGGALLLGQVVVLAGASLRGARRAARAGAGLALEAAR